jgi:enamine deaminase RidA (YjgF/YER057c/UK114 family)
MKPDTKTEKQFNFDLNHQSPAEIDEMRKLGILDDKQEIQQFIFPDFVKEKRSIKKHAVHAVHTLSEAYNYQRPSSFSRALCLNIADYNVLLISGTASVDENGKSIHVGDFRAQCWRTYRNITELLKAEEMTWHDVVRTSCYLRDMSRDYKDFNEIRTSFYSWLGLEVLPASTGIQVTICREDLLVEIEAIAITQVKK